MSVPCFDGLLYKRTRSLVETITMLFKNRFSLDLIFFFPRLSAIFTVICIKNVAESKSGMIQVSDDVTSVILLLDWCFSFPVEKLISRFPGNLAILPRKKEREIQKKPPLTHQSRREWAWVSEWVRAHVNFTSPWVSVSSLLQISTFVSEWVSTVYNTRVEGWSGSARVKIIEKSL